MAEGVRVCFAIWQITHTCVLARPTPLYRCDAPRPEANGDCLDVQLNLSFVDAAGVAVAVPRSFGVVGVRLLGGNVTYRGPPR